VAAGRAGVQRGGCAAPAPANADPAAASPLLTPVPPTPPPQQQHLRQGPGRGGVPVPVWRGLRSRRGRAVARAAARGRAVAAQVRAARRAAPAPAPPPRAAAHGGCGPPAAASRLARRSLHLPLLTPPPRQSLPGRTLRKCWAACLGPQRCSWGTSWPPPPSRVRRARGGGGGGGAVVVTPAHGLDASAAFDCGSVDGRHTFVAASLTDIRPTPLQAPRSTWRPPSAS
jgi:hypothetical protein